MGRYCPFGSFKGWTSTDLLVLRNGVVWVPKKIQVTKVVEEYAPLSNTDATPAIAISVAKAVKEAAKRAPVKRARR